MGPGKSKRRPANRRARVIAASVSALAIVLATVAVLLLPNGDDAANVGSYDPLPQKVAESNASPIGQGEASETVAGGKTDARGADNENGGAARNDADNANEAPGQSALGPDGNPPSGTAPSSAQLASQIPPIEEIPKKDVPTIMLEHESDVVLAQIAPSASLDDVNAALAKADGVRPQQATPEDMTRGYVKLHTAEGVSAELAIAQLREAPALRDAQPNYLYQIADDGTGNGGGNLVAQDISLDDDKNLLWKQWALNSVNAYEAWDLAGVAAENTGGNSGAGGDEGAGSTAGMQNRVTVAVIDNGFFTDHEDLRDNIVDTYNAVEDGKPKGERDPAKVKDVSPDFDSHGTHVAGIISAKANNGKGIAGVSYNAGLLLIQVFKSAPYSPPSASSEDIARAYDYLLSDTDGNGKTIAQEYNVRVANLSLGAGAEHGDDDLDDEDRLLIDKVGEAHAAGILTVCSAGNDADLFDGPYLNYPSDWLGEELSVIALEEGPPVSRVDFSNYNQPNQETKDLAAPGGSIISTTFSSSLNGPLKSTYDCKSGTSMAAPCVAGVAALVCSVNGGLDADEIASLLCNTATDLGDEGQDVEYGWGEVNAARAVARARNSVFLEGSKSLFAQSSVGGQEDSGNAPTGQGDGETLDKHTSTKLVPMLDGKEAGGQWSWTSSDESVASVSSDGTVASGKPGTAVITATLTRTESNQEPLVGTKTITVYDVSFSGEHELRAFSSMELTFTNSPSTGRWLIDTSDSSIASVSDGEDAGKTKVTAQSVGEADIIARLSSGDGLSCSHHIKVVPASLGNLLPDDPELSVTGLDGLVYTGEAVKPVPTIRYGGRRLVEGVDFTVVSYDDNEEIGTASLTIEGKGNFAGTRTMSFGIAKPDLAKAKVSVSGWTYDGTEHTPAVTVTIGKQTLQPSLYNVSYSGNRDAGTCTATVTSANNDYCTGTAKGRCSVAPKPLTSATLADLRPATYTGAAQTPEPTVRVGSALLEKGTDYTLSYKNNVAPGTAIVTAIGKGNYAGSKKAMFTILPKSISSASIEEVAARTYTGKAFTPTPAVYLGSSLLANGTDYALSYSDNVNAGTATITVAGTGNYMGSKSTTFTIAKTANPMTIKAKTKKVKYSKVKKRKRTVSGAITFKKRARGSVTYARIAKGSSKRLSISKKTGKITVKKGTKPGTYKIKVKVTASGNANYAARSRTVAVKVLVV